MSKIPNIAGLSVKLVNGARTVEYKGKLCPLISREQELCEENTSYNGDVLYSMETYGKENMTSKFD